MTPVRRPSVLRCCSPKILQHSKGETLKTCQAILFHSMPSCLFQLCPTCGAEIKVTSPEFNQGVLLIVDTRMSKKQIQLDCYGCYGPGRQPKKSAPPSSWVALKSHLHMIQYDSRCFGWNLTRNLVGQHRACRKWCPCNSEPTSAHDPFRNQELEPGSAQKPHTKVEQRPLLQPTNDSGPKITTDASKESKGSAKSTQLQSQIRLSDSGSSPDEAESGHS